MLQGDEDYPLTFRPSESTEITGLHTPSSELKVQ